MTDPDVIQRINLFKRKLWQFPEVKNWYDIDLSVEGGFVARLKIWTTRFDDTTILNDFAYSCINHHYLELFMQDLGLTAKRGAAAQLGMAVESFNLFLKKGMEKKIIAEHEAQGVYPEVGVFSTQWVGDLHRRFPALEKMTFTSFSSFCRLLHKEIKEALGFEVIEQICPTSKAIGESLPEIGYEIDIITQEPVGLPFQIWLETDKPIQLKPDVCSWLTYIKHEAVLSSHAWSQRNEQFELKRDVLKALICK